MLPVYKLIEVRAQIINQFKIQVKIKNTKAEFGIGPSKKTAEQNAAKN